MYLLSDNEISERKEHSSHVHELLVVSKLVTYISIVLEVVIYQDFFFKQLTRKVY